MGEGIVNVKSALESLVKGLSCSRRRKTASDTSLWLNGGSSFEEKLAEF